MLLCYKLVHIQSYKGGYALLYSTYIQVMRQAKTTSQPINRQLKIKI